MIIPNLDIMDGVRLLLDNYIQIQNEHHVIISFWHECDYAASWIACELKMRGSSLSLHRFCERDESSYRQELDTLIKESTKPIVIIVLENTILSASRYLKHLHLQPEIKVWRLMNASEALFTQSLKYPRENIRDINAWLLSKLKTEDYCNLKVINGLDTELYVTLHGSRYRWVSSHGFSAAHELITLPIGEINSYPEKISGRFKAFGAIHANVHLPFDTQLEKNPIYLEIKDGLLIHFYCENKIITQFLNQAFSFEHVRKVGEFGIGTNIGVTQFTSGNSHINERFPGVHLGFGQHLQPPEIINYHCDIHIDFISPYGEIELLDSHEVIDLSRLSQVQKVAHPQCISSEDVESVEPL